MRRVLIVAFVLIATQTFATQRWARPGGLTSGSATDSATGWRLTYGAAHVASGETLWVCKGNHYVGGVDAIVPTASNVTILARCDTVHVWESDASVYIYDLSNVKISGYAGGRWKFHKPNSYSVISSAGTAAYRGNLLEYCVFDSCGEYGYSLYIGNALASAYYLKTTQVKNCAFTNFVRTCSGDMTDAIWVQWTDSSDVSYNIFGRYTHTSGVNWWQSMNFSQHHNYHRGPTHGYLGTNKASRQFVIQDEFFWGGCEDNCDPPPSSGGNLQVEGYRGIVRYNIMGRDSTADETNGMSYDAISAYDDGVHTYNIAVYHNTMWERVASGVTYPAYGAKDKAAFGISAGGSGSTTDSVRVRNNIVCWGANSALAGTIHYEGGTPGTWPTVTFDGNRIWRWDSRDIIASWPPSSSWSLASAKASYPTQWGSANTTGDPLFSDTAKTGSYNFPLSATSPCIDAAVPLATITVNSSSTTLTVDYPWMFWPGNGFLGPDSIIVGSNAAVVITGVYDASKTITIGSAITATIGDGVYIKRSGAKVDDIGATQYSNGEPPPLAPNAPVASAPTGVSRTTFTAAWSAVDSVSGYKLDVAYDQSFTSYVAGYQDKSTVSTTESLSGLATGTLFFYRVRAYNGNGTSGNSNIQSTRTFRSGRLRR